MQILKGQENDLVDRRSVGYEQEHQPRYHWPNAYPEESKSDPREIDYEESKCRAISNKLGSESKEPRN